MVVVRGGQAVYGAAIGILMLEARFPRVIGDVGNALTFDFPVHYRVVKQASPDRVVRQNAQGLLDAFIEAALDLKAHGVAGITTNCGFLSIYQRELAEAVGLPVAASNLMQFAMIEALLPPGQKVGIITISKATLTGAHLRAAGVPDGTPIIGTDDGEEFSRAILGDELHLDLAKSEADLLAAAKRLVAEHPDVGAILLECTNMCPFSAKIATETGLPVFDMAGFIRWFQAGLRPRQYPVGLG